MNTKKRLTVKEIAREVGLSVATVDRVLNKRGNVKPQTVQLVMDKIREMEYTPNRSASFLSKGRSISLAVAFPELPEYFWSQVEKGIDAAVRELRDFGLEVRAIRSKDYDLTDQKKTMLQLVDSGEYDAIAISPNDPQEMTDVIDYAMSKGVVVGTFNSDSPLSSRLFYVGCDYRVAGRLAADTLCRMVGRRGRIGLIMSYTNFQMQQKVTGFREVIGSYPQVELRAPLKVDQEEYTSFETFSDYFEGLDGIYVASAKLHVIARHLEAAGLAGRTVLIGHDMNEEIRDGLQRDTVTASICQDPFNQGYLIVKSLFEYMSSRKLPGARENMSRLELVTRENAMYY
ncbi:LacI family DNA-binding transcriptional regulator [Saccharibacillus alkalitolerans]|uniref:Substrate-binding domain-containing protein n=1 Tax=Saccharibacillus alkalitolerans TaxID=2705290 RepID=A0ABX0F4K5_9BACL|nr:LacI family DNA-binding transcriptional regulator [Saccharibacillus alkalitolerans]NGZ74934.1 substrate-binding domain-containing protein [Saccharibacillus alkalitolerans]